MHLPVPIDRRTSRRAAALVAVLFVIGMLSLMLATTALIVRSDAELATSQKKAFRATQLAEMGIAIAANPVVKKTDQVLLNQTIFQDETFSVKIKGEGENSTSTPWSSRPRPMPTTGASPSKSCWRPWGWTMTNSGP